MTDGWSLSVLLESLHQEIQDQLARARVSFAHSTTKGDASELIWLELLQTYLPQRYRVDTAHAVDSLGKFSEQIDVVVYDRQYSPFIFNFKGQKIVPAESVYAVFEAKQKINLDLVGYAQKKCASVRKLSRTSLPVPHVGGVSPAKVPQHILSGLLTLESDWSPPLGKALRDALEQVDDDGRLDIGCIAAHGHYAIQPDGQYLFNIEGKPATAFLFELIARLQDMATVPMIDIRAYAKWIVT